MMMMMMTQPSFPRMSVTLPAHIGARDVRDLSTAVFPIGRYC